MLLVCDEPRPSTPVWAPPTDHHYRPRMSPTSRRLSNIYPDLMYIKEPHLSNVKNESIFLDSGRHRPTGQSNHRRTPIVGVRPGALSHLGSDQIRGLAEISKP